MQNNSTEKLSEDKFIEQELKKLTSVIVGSKQGDELNKRNIAVFRNIISASIEYGKEVGRRNVSPDLNWSEADFLPPNNQL